MKKLIYLAAIALAVVATSCNYKSVETPLNDELISFTAKTDDGNIVYGVKNINGDEVIPARYDSISICVGYICAADNYENWIYTLNGDLVFNKPFDIVSQKDDNLLLLGGYESYLLTGDKKYRFSQTTTYCFVHNKDNEPIISGGSVIYLTADNIDYFIVYYSHDKTEAYDKDGNHLFSVDKEKINKELPQPTWTDVAVERRITDKSINQLKLEKKKRR